MQDELGLFISHLSSQRALQTARLCEAVKPLRRIKKEEIQEDIRRKAGCPRVAAGSKTQLQKMDKICVI